MQTEPSDPIADASLPTLPVDSPDFWADPERFVAPARLEHLQEGLHLIAQRLHNIRRNGEVAWRPFLGAWGLRTLPIAFEVR